MSCQASFIFNRQVKMCCDESGTETVVELQTDVLPSGTLRRKQTLKSFKAKFENRFVDTHPL